MSDILTVPEMAKLLKISRSKAYSKEKDFPIIKIGKSIRILKNELYKWLNI